MRFHTLLCNTQEAGAGPHHLPKSDPIGDYADEGGLRPLSDDHPMEVDYPETRSRADALGEVTHDA